MGEPRRVRAAALLALAVLFLVSGATALVYEVSWTRRLLLVVGSTATAAAVVLSAFLGGLGAGGFLGARLADRSTRPLRLYGVLEVLAAGWAVLVPVLLDAVEGPFLRAVGALAPGARTALRAGLAAAVVVPGAALLGATLPALLRHAVRRPGEAGPRTALLYGVNALGAVGGALWAGWSGIFTLGVSGAARAAALVAAALGLVAIAWGSTRRAPADPAPREAARGRVPRGALAAALACGFVGLGLEAAGVRLLVYFVEGFTASFAAMLAAFLLGIGLGSLVLGPLLARRLPPRATLGALLALSGAAAAVLAASLPRLDALFDSVRSWAFSSREPATAQRLAALVGSLALFFPPALLLGAAFPVAIRWGTALGASPARAAGRVYLWNSVGSAAAPLAFLAALPFEGAFAVWASVAVVGLATGLGTIASAALGGGRRGALAGLGVGAFVAAFGLPTARDLATPEALVRASRVLHTAPGEPVRDLREVRSDATTTASAVHARGGERFLYTDEFQAAATGPTYQYMRMLGHLPALLAARQEHAMNIAFGTGTTAGALAAHAGVRRLEVVEVSRAVLSLAPHFVRVNRGVLDDPRVVVRVEDGRHALAVHAPDLDVVALEPLMPYTPAALPFYTADFYALAKARLREGGVLCQWVPVHAMPVDVYAALVRTFFEAFPDGTLWFFEQSSVLVGRRGGQAPDADALKARAAEVARELAAAGLAAPPMLAAAYVASGRRVLDVLRASPPGPRALDLVTDEHPFPEAYPLPRAGLVTPYARDVLALLESFVDAQAPAPPELAFVPAQAIQPLLQAARTGLAARRDEADALYRFAIAATEGPAGAARRQEAVLRLDEAVRSYERANAATRSGDRALVRRGLRARRQLLGIQARGLFAEVRSARAAGDETRAKAKAEEALTLARRAYAGGVDDVATERPAAAALLGEALVRLGRCREAERVLVEAAAKWPGTTRVRDLLTAVQNRRLGRDDLTARSPAAAALLADFAPCEDDDLGPAGGPLDRFTRAMAIGSASQMRTEAASLRRLVAERGLSPQRIAKAIDATSPTFGPEALAVRAALLRALLPDDLTLTALLRSPDPARQKAAVLETARGGVQALALEEPFLAAARSPDATVRAVVARALAVDATPWAQGQLLDLLADPEESVRRAALAALATRLPEPPAFDPAADEPTRAAALLRLRETLAPR